MLSEYTWTLAKAAYEKGEKEFKVTPRYPMYPKKDGCAKCQAGCDFVHFHHRDSNYLMLKCAYCSVELKGGLFEIGINDKPVNRKRMFSDWMRWEILKRDGCRCVVCGAGPAEAELEADHIWPHSMGGPTVLENGATLCRNCNQAKSGKFDTVFIMRELARINTTPEETVSGDLDVPFRVWKRCATMVKLWTASAEGGKDAGHG